MHGWGVTEALAGLPDWVVLLFAILTQLADAWFVFGGLSLLYLLGDERLATRPRRTAAVLLALGICTLSATVTFKTFFGVHRPAGAGTATAPTWLPVLFESVYTNISTGDGFGFPSGHATSSTIVYGGLALYLDRLWTRRKRLVAAASIVVVVALSRLVIGVHHLPDVLVGVFVGSLVLLSFRWFADDEPERAFLAASVFGLVSVVAAAVFAPEHPDEALKAAIAVGAAAGAAVAWVRTGGEHPPIPVAVAVAAAATFGAGWGSIYVAGLPPSVSAVGSALVVGAMVALPGVVSQRGGAASTSAE